MAVLRLLYSLLAVTVCAVLLLVYLTAVTVAVFVLGKEALP